MRVTNDDAIWRYQPRLIDLRGWTVVGQPRYVVLLIAGVVAALTAPVFIGLFGVWPGALYAAAVAFLGGFFLAPYFTSERPLVAWVAYLRGEWRAWRHWARCRWWRTGDTKPRTHLFGRGGRAW